MIHANSSVSSAGTLNSASVCMMSSAAATVAGNTAPQNFVVTWASGDQAIAYALRITRAHPTTPIGKTSAALGNPDIADFDAMTTSSNDSLLFATVATSTNTTICGQWSAPFTGVDCFFNGPNDSASIAFNTYANLGSDVKPIFSFLNPPDSHRDCLDLIMV